MKQCEAAFCMHTCTDTQVKTCISSGNHLPLLYANYCLVRCLRLYSQFYSYFPLELDTQGRKQSLKLLKLCSWLIVHTLGTVQDVRLA